MFDISWSELLLIGVVALVAIGPKELPTVLRTVGQWMGKLRRMAAEFQSQFQEAMREAEMADLKKQVDELTTQAQSYTNFDPVGEVRREFESAQHQIETAMTSNNPATVAAGATPAAEGVAPATPSSADAAAPSDAGPAAAAPASAPAQLPFEENERGTAAAADKPA
jgi:sec-independent protein translocase protein TatB